MIEKSDSTRLALATIAILGQAPGIKNHYFFQLITDNDEHTMSSLSLLLIIGVLIWLWLASLKSRDIAIQTARGSCNHQGLQLLDATVSLQKIRPYYENSNDYGVKRTYVFDYSDDGVSRQTGCIVMHNTRVVTVILEDR